jgi:hypothetical protein
VFLVPFPVVGLERPLHAWPPRARSRRSRASERCARELRGRFRAHADEAVYGSDQAPAIQPIPCGQQLLSLPPRASVPLPRRAKGPRPVGILPRVCSGPPNANQGRQPPTRPGLLHTCGQLCGQCRPTDQRGVARGHTSLR